MTTYSIEPEQRTLHGSFSREFPPVLTIDSGDTVCFRTLDVGWGLEPRLGRTTPRKTWVPRLAGRDDGHALCGPVAIRGAQPGMTLEIRIGEICPGAWGWTSAGGRSTDYNHKLGVAEEGTLLVWTLDKEREKMIGRNQFGQTIVLHPFMGILGMPPDEPGVHSTLPPRACGGNIDCKELVSGSVLYLPIFVPGALFSTGDGHAAQGDGEVSGTAIECPIERAELTFFLHDAIRLTTPRAFTPAGWLTLGFDKKLEEATMIALNAMLDLLCEQHGMTRAEALALASSVVDLRITQIVNGGVFGVHALLPHDVFHV
jgi:acetamidase/formamidase